VGTRLSRLFRPFAWLRRVWLRIRAWRRVSFTVGGLVFTLGTFAVGFAAMNTGNNLLHMLLGAMLGFIVVSSWLSEQVIRDVEVHRQVPRAVTVGRQMRLIYAVTNHKPRVPTMALEISEVGLPNRAFVGHVAAGATEKGRSTNIFVRRGIYTLGTVTLSTAFPFGLFLKERDLEIPGEIVVWPRTDRRVPTPAPGGGRVPRTGLSPRGAAGHRGEYRSLRQYRPGDDPRDIHWRSSARLREPVIREYERDGAETRWICLDVKAEPGEAAEAAVEVAAALAARASAEARPFALVAGDRVVDPGQGPGQLERVLDALARVDFDPDAPRVSLPVDPSMCVLVSPSGASRFGDALVVGGT
jgi:uncharacterized protein (DUF58 family)